MELLYNARKYQIHPPKRFWNELSLIRRIWGHLLEGLKSQRKNRQKIFLNEQPLLPRTLDGAVVEGVAVDGAVVGGQSAWLAVDEASADVDG